MAVRLAIAALGLLLAAPALSAPPERVAGAALPDTDELQAVLTGDAARGARTSAARHVEPDFPSWQVDPGRASARSVGAPNDGRLRDGVPLPAAGPGFVRVDRDTHFGTDETIALLRYVAARFDAAFPGTAPLFVGDISREGGGRLRPHRSHRTGRDVDIAFPERGNRTRRGFAGTLAADDVDLDKTWFLLETLILTGRVQYLFVDAALLPRLAARARDFGWSDDAVDHLFLTPDESSRRGTIRSVRGHDDHVHVRFHCPEADADCTSY